MTKNTAPAITSKARNLKDTMKISAKTQDAIEKVAQGWSWDNYRHEANDDAQDKGEYWTIFEALYCKLSWVQEVLTDKNIVGDYDVEEHINIIKDTMTIVEALQKDIKFQSMKAGHGA